MDALVAREGLLPSVDPPVGDEERHPAEGLPAVWTPVGGSVRCASWPPGLVATVGSPHHRIPSAAFRASTCPRGPVATGLQLHLSMWFLGALLWLMLWCWVCLLG